MLDQREWIGKKYLILCPCPFWGNSTMEKLSQNHRYTREIPDLLYHPVLSAMGSNWGSSGFCRPHAQTQTQNKCVHNLAVFYACLSSRSMQATYPPDVPRLFWLRGKNPEDPQFEPHAGIKMGADSEISPVFRSKAYQKKKIQMVGSTHLWSTIPSIIPAFNAWQTQM